MTTQEPVSARTQTGQIAASELSVGSVVANRFRIEGLLGIGGMGMVYRAMDLALDVPVAIKLLRAEVASKPGAFERFRQELLLSRQVSSPQVVRIHDLAEHEGRWLISMDLVEGESLDKVIDRRGPLPVDEALGIARQIAQGLLAAHQREIVHRDLKPANVLIDVRGDAAITDFGIARSLGASGITHTGAVVGTPDYLSPEQARGGVIDGRSDLYALGLVLYEMLAGTPAFAGSTSAESLSRRLLGPPPPISSLREDVPGWVQRLLERMLQPQAARRLPNAGAVLAAFESRQVPRDWRPGRGALAALVAAVVAIVFAVVWIARDPTLSPVLPALQAPDRWVLAPTAHTNFSAADAAAIRAIDHHLRQGLDALPGLVVVESERTMQAVAQLGLRDGRRFTGEAVRGLVSARKALQLEVTRDAAGLAWTVVDERQRAAVPTQGARSTAVSFVRGAPDAASRAIQAVGSSKPFPVDLWPRNDAALIAMGEGLDARLKGRLDVATAAFSRAVDADPTYAAAWLELADTNVLAGLQEPATAAVKRGLAASPPDAIAERLRYLDVAASRDARSAVAALRARAQAEPDDLDAQRRLASLLGDQGDRAAAIRTLRKVVARDEGDARAWFLLGKNAILHGDLREAVDNYLLRALLLYRRGGDAFGQAETVNALGVGYARLGQTVQATRQYREAVELRRALGNRRGVASSLRNLAQLTMVRGDFDAARQQLDEARVLFEELDDRTGLAAVDNELGLLAEEQGDYAAALVAYRRGLQSREAVGEAHAIAESLNNIGFAHFQLGAYDSAQVFWRQALEAFTRADDPSGVVRVEQNLGLLATARGQWDEAQRLLDASLASAERQQMLEESAVSHRNLAELSMWRGHLDDAARASRVARGLFAEREDQRGLADLALLQARLALLARDAHEARRLLGAAEAAFVASSPEQRALRHLLESEIAMAEGDVEVARKSLGAAVPLAAQSGVLAVQLQVEATRLALDGGAVDALLPKLAALGNVNVQLDSLMRVLRARVGSRDWSGAAPVSQEVLQLLEALGSHAFAMDAHRLRAQVLAARSDAAAAEAVAAARTALAKLLEHASPDQRRTLQSETRPATSPGQRR